MRLGFRADSPVTKWSAARISSPEKGHGIGKWSAPTHGRPGPHENVPAATHPRVSDTIGVPSGTSCRCLDRHCFGTRGHCYRAAHDPVAEERKGRNSGRALALREEI